MMLLFLKKIETECLKPDSVVLQQIGLALLKNVSSHRGLKYGMTTPAKPFLSSSLTDSDSHEIFDEYTRRQFVAKDSEINPFGTDETPAKFAQFDVFTKVTHTSTQRLWGTQLMQSFLASLRSESCSR